MTGPTSARWSTRGNGIPASISPLVDRETWDRVQALLGGQVYRTHELTYGSDLITCQCGHKIVGERKIKQTKAGERDYIYYRCSKYSEQGASPHPADRSGPGPASSGPVRQAAD